MDQQYLKDRGRHLSGAPLELYELTQERSARRGDDKSGAKSPSSAQSGKSLSPGRLLFLAGKRVFDIVASVVLLLLFAPILAVCAVLIKRESPGPAIFRRRVLARQDWNESMGMDVLKTFDAYKLRTMIPDAEDYLARHPHLFVEYQKDWKLEDDPRVTKLGAFLRSTSLDEVPQLLNVLRGQMTLIGPRMITIPELSRYGENSSEMLGAQPGLTGLWQVSGRHLLPHDERVKLDLLYIRTQSAGMDFWVLLRTVKCVLLRIGAY